LSLDNGQCHTCFLDFLLISNLACVPSHGFLAIAAFTSCCIEEAVLSILMRKTLLLQRRCGSSIGIKASFQILLH
jgi:hypothetical protein